MRSLALALVLLTGCAGTTTADDTGNICALVDCATDTNITLSFFDDAGPALATDVFWSVDGGAQNSVECPDTTCSFAIPPDDGTYIFGATNMGWAQTREVELVHPEDGECCPGVLSENYEFHFIADGDGR